MKQHPGWFIFQCPRCGHTWKESSLNVIQMNYGSECGNCSQICMAIDDEDDDEVTVAHEKKIIKHGA